MQTIGIFTPDNFIAGGYPIAKAGVTAGATALKKYAPVKLNADGAAAPVTLGVASDADPDNAIPAQTADEATVAGLYGIAAEPAAANAEAVLYLTGEFFASALTLENGVNADVLTPAFRKLGIFLKYKLLV